jgi:four helix bundle protein
MVEKSKQSYKDLKVWQLGLEVSAEVVKLTERFPKTLQYTLGSQIQRAAISIPSNLAEGSNRQTYKEYLQFAYIAKGSLAELETQLAITEKINIVEKTLTDSLTLKCEELGRMLSGLIRALREKVT